MWDRCEVDVVEGKEKEKEKLERENKLIVEE